MMNLEISGKKKSKWAEFEITGKCRAGNTKPAIRAGFIGHCVGRTGQSSNLLIKDLEKIKDFLEQHRILLDLIEDPF